MISLLGFKGKKAQSVTRSRMAVILLLFVFGINAIFSSIILDGVDDAFQQTPFYNGQLAETSVKFREAPLLFDDAIVVLMVIAILATGVASIRVAASSVAFIFTMFMVFFEGLIAFFFNFIFIQFAQQAVISDTILNFPRTVFILTNLHWVLLATVIVMSITLYGKKEKGQFLP